MADVDLDKVVRTAKIIVSDAAETSSLDQLTPRLIRQMVEKELGIPVGTLDTKEYKDAVRAAVSDAMDALGPPEEEAEPEVSKPSKKAGTSKKPAKASKRKSGSAPTDDSESPPAKKPRASPKKAQAKPRPPKGKNGKAVRSASVVPSSEEEDGANKTSSAQKTKRPSLPKNKSENDADISSTDVGGTPIVKEGQKLSAQTSDDGAETVKTAKPKSKLSQSVTAQDIAVDEQQEGPSANDGGDEKSESELSVLIDEPPKRTKGKKKDKPETQSAKRTRKSKDATEESPDDLEIKRLKSFVTACGIRKRWAKEFENMNDKKSQIRRLKEILSELGMTGRLSMEKAKALRAQRDLAQELEDVQNFEKAIVRGPQPSTSRLRGVEREAQSSDGNESDIEGIPPKKRAGNARANIDAFLGDQSDDD